MFDVYITDYIKDPDIEQRVLGPSVNIICLEEENEAKFPSSIETADALLVWHATISKKTISRLKNCKVIVRYGVGYDNVDYKYALQRGIYFCNNPDYGVHEVADTACSMILALSRKIISYDYASKAVKSSWQEHIINPIKRTCEHNLGIIGIGRIGTAVALRMKSFGMDIAFYDPYVASGYEKSLGVQRFETLEKLQEFSSIISLHTPLTEETLCMVDENFINHLNRNTIFINTARGKIVKDLDTLFFGLMNGKLIGIGLDVLPQEPPLKSEKLIQAWKDKNNELYTKIIITPHTSYYSDLSWKEMRIKASDNVKRVLDGGKPKNLIIDNFLFYPK